MSGANNAELAAQSARTLPGHAGCGADGLRNLLANVSPGGLADYATELLGLDIQAVILARSRSDRSGGLQVWELTTPFGPFWLVEDGMVAEMFAVANRKTRRHPAVASGVMQAMARYRELHVACGDVSAKATAPYDRDQSR